MSAGNADQSIVDSYIIVHSVTGGTTTSAPVTFPFGVTSGDIDLMLAENGGKGEETKAYRVAILITAKPAGTGTVVVTGASAGGPEEFIASLAIDCTADITETGDWRIIDTITATKFHLGRGIDLADSGNSHPAKFGFDAIGYRYLKFYVTSLTTITDVKIYVRFL
ncbi:MAG TPA: hypothetical protein ENI05_02640 [Porticoccus sp.]|nr:hypothetical protein [Porticoccus sp.]